MEKQRHVTKVNAIGRKAGLPCSLLSCSNERRNLCFLHQYKQVWGHRATYHRRLNNRTSLCYTKRRHHCHRSGGFRDKSDNESSLACDRHAVESDATLTEEKMKEIIGYCCVVCDIQILPFPRDQFASDVEFDI